MNLSALINEAPHATEGQEHKRSQPTKMWRLGVCRVWVLGQNSYIKLHSPRAQGPLQMRGWKDCKKQGGGA